MCMIIWGSLKTYLRVFAQLVPSTWNALSALIDYLFPSYALRSRPTQLFLSLL